MGKFDLNLLLYEKSRHYVEYPGIPLRILWAFAIAVFYLFLAANTVTGDFVVWCYLPHVSMVSFLIIEWNYRIHIFSSDRLIDRKGSPILFRVVDFSMAIILPYLLLAFIVDRLAIHHPELASVLASIPAMAFLLIATINITYAIIHLNHHIRYLHWLYVHDGRGNMKKLFKCDVIWAWEGYDGLKVRIYQNGIRDLEVLDDCDISEFYSEFDPKYFTLTQDGVIENHEFPKTAPISSYEQRYRTKLWKALLPIKPLTPQKLKEFFDCADTTRTAGVSYSAFHYYGLGTEIEIHWGKKRKRSFPNHPVIAWPPPRIARKEKIDYSIYLSLVDGQVEYRYSANSYLPYKDCPKTTKREDIKLVNAIFEWHLGKLKKFH